MRARLPVALVAATLAVASGDARSKPRATPRTAPEAAAEPATPVPVPALTSTRPDGLRLAVISVPGPGVSFRLTVQMRGLQAHHTTTSTAWLVGGAALFSGNPGAALGGGGAQRSVDVAGDALMLSVDTLRERWRDDLASFLDGVSSPALAEPALSAAAFRPRSFGPRHELGASLTALAQRLDRRHVALNAPGVGVTDATLDAAVYHVEQAWTSDSMTLVVAGELSAEEVGPIVESHFLVPASVATEAPAATAGTRLEPEDLAEGATAYLTHGAYASGVPPADALVVLELLLGRILSQAPRAGDCVGLYQPELLDPTLLVQCGGVDGSALDVRLVMDRAFDGAATAPTAAQLKEARAVALTRLRADHTSCARLADRLARWAAVGLDGGAGLELAVAATQDASLTSSLSTLLAAERSIRVHRKGRGISR